MIKVNLLEKYEKLFSDIVNWSDVKKYRKYVRLHWLLKKMERHFDLNNDYKANSLYKKIYSYKNQIKKGGH